ncbi:hypothetical protein M9Y10_024592 [Tritrichomonas musculus]|uniref:Protein kinase domain-containing protein n=1 Tax=Tritrichomonas musculus TaxID=1915356 RepID=A0ABR2HAQ2_9EUKA
MSRKKDRTNSNPIDIYLINLNDYDIVRNINHGGFGIINLVKNKKTNEKYAAKTNLIQNKTQNKFFISREVRILAQIQHLTIIQFRGFSYVDFHGEKNITILMDYMKEGSLAHLIDKESKSLCPSNYDNTKRQIILVGIARGMMLLHSQFVIHRDLKPENILLDSDYHPRITDFGLSKFFDPHHSMNQSMTDSGTAAYMAPEVISSDHFNTKADVFAFGILMYEVIGGKRAYENLLQGKKRINEFQLKMKVQEGLRPKFDFPIKKGLQLMIEKCWSKDPKERPTFEEIFKKLSLSSEDYFLQFEENHQEPKIILDEDDEIDEDEAGFLLNKSFCLEDVDTVELLDYVDEIKEEKAKAKDNENENENEELKKEIKKLNQKVKSQSEKILSLEEAEKKNKEMTDQIKEMEKKIKEQAEKIAKLEKMKKNDSLPVQPNFGRFFSVDLSLKEPGILHTLKKQEKSPFDRLFVASQSSSDIYNIIAPDTKDYFSTYDEGDFFIQFELKESVMLSGVTVFTSSENFPKSFDIEVEGKVVKSVKNATELNGEDRQMTVNFKPTRGKKVRFIQTGKNWDDEDNYLFVKRIELLSTEKKYSGGVFATLVANSENKDPHKCPVFISASCFDNNSFYLVDSSCPIMNENGEKEWFQVELTRGVAILNGFRLERDEDTKLRNYKIICTDDSSKPESSWTTLIEINEKKEDEHELLDIYEFPHPSPLTRFVRLVSTGQNWDGSNDFKFIHFDVFGSYF